MIEIFRGATYHLKVLIQLDPFLEVAHLWKQYVIGLNAN